MSKHHPNTSSRCHLHTHLHFLAPTGLIREGDTHIHVSVSPQCIFLLPFTDSSSSLSAHWSPSRVGKHIFMSQCPLVFFKKEGLIFISRPISLLRDGQIHLHFSAPLQHIFSAPLAYLHVSMSFQHIYSAPVAYSSSCLSATLASLIGVTCSQQHLLFSATNLGCLLHLL